MFRAAKQISVIAALSFRQSVSVAKVLSGFAVLIYYPNVAITSIPESHIPARSPTLKKPPVLQNESELEQRLKATASLAEKEISEILLGWSIEIRTFELPSIRCHEFVLRAETPEEWRWNRRGDDGCIVSGLPRQVWDARLPVHEEIFYARDRLGSMQHILGRLCEYAHDIKRKAVAPSV